MKASDLDQFTGTENWHKISNLFPFMLLTDGTKYLADNAKCYWLFDIIASHQRNNKVRLEEFQVWKLVCENESGVVTCDDGNGNILAKQKIEYTDFPFSSVKLYAVWENGNMIVLLPSEY
jgi:hypothetical protein